ncbi:MAG: TolB family protein [Acidimicrobiia bacterium]
MSNVDELLRQAATDLRNGLAEITLPAVPTERRRPLGWMVTAAVAAGVVVAGLVLLAPFAGGDAEPTIPVLEPRLTAPTVSAGTNRPATTFPTTSTLAVRVPATGPVFGEETNVMLLFDDGIDGLTAVDLDRRLAGRSVVEGQRAGDEPYSMVRVGGKLVVGWSEIYAVDIATRQATALGAATVFVPAAESDRVWMIDHQGGIGANPAVVWQVDMSGETLTEPVTLFDGANPVLGVVGGLALDTQDGLAIWDSDTGRITTIDPAPALPIDVHSDELVWCGGDCLELVVTNTATLESERYLPPEGYQAFVGLSVARFSPDGRFLAALVGDQGSGDGKALWILDRESGDSTMVSDPESHVDFLAWSPSGDQLFATSSSDRLDRIAIWRYAAHTGEFSAVVAPFGGGIRPVAVDDSVADAYVSEIPGSEVECPAPSHQPSGRSGICTFEY